MYRYTAALARICSFMDPIIRTRGLRRLHKSSYAMPGGATGQRASNGNILVRVQTNAAIAVLLHSGCGGNIHKRCTTYMSLAATSAEVRYEREKEDDVDVFELVNSDGVSSLRCVTGSFGQHHYGTNGRTSNALYLTQPPGMHRVPCYRLKLRLLGPDTS